LIAERVRRLTERRGLLDSAEADIDWSESLQRHCQAASVRGRIGLGEMAGARVTTRVLPGHPSPLPAVRRGVMGFDLHVGARIRAGDRKRLERLCRYVMRPPLAKERLTELPGNRYRYEFRHPWRDGTVAVEFSGLELIEKLVAIIPAPRKNLVRYHGSLAPNAKLRRSIMPLAATATVEEEPPCAKEREQEPEDAERVARGHRWAELMRRVFKKDVLRCPRCDGRLQLVATIVEGHVIREILAAIGLSARPPPLAPARGPWQQDLDLESP